MTQGRYSYNDALAIKDVIIANLLLCSDDIKVEKTRVANRFCVVVLMDILEFKNILEMRKNGLLEFKPSVINPADFQSKISSQNNQYYTQYYTQQSVIWHSNLGTDPDQNARVQMANTHIDFFPRNIDSLVSNTIFTLRIMYGSECIELSMKHRSNNQYASQEFDENQVQKIAFSLASILGLLPNAGASKREVTVNTLAIIKNKKEKFRLVIWDLKKLIPILSNYAQLKDVERECNRLLKEWENVNIYVLERRELIDKIAEALQYPFTHHVVFQLAEGQEKTVRVIAGFGEKYNMKTIPWENIKTISAAILAYRLSHPFRTLVESEIIKWFPCSNQTEVLEYMTEPMRQAEVNRLTSVYIAALKLNQDVIKVNLIDQVSEKYQIKIEDIISFDRAIKAYMVAQQIKDIP